jgi:DNA-binding beta-propeller fold protein YncE
VRVVERATGATFEVPAPPAAYGVAFAPDGKYLYLGSSQRGTVTRIDLAARKIDKQVAGPRFLHHLVIAPNGRTLYALASSSMYSVYDLPDLKARTEHAHPSDLAPAMAQLSGHGMASADGAYFVAPDVDTAQHGDTRGYVIARFAD